MPPDHPSPVAAPTFTLLARQPIRPGTFLLAALLAAGAFFLFKTAMDHARHKRAAPDRSAAAPQNAPSAADRPEDPNSVDTITLGDPADAPEPGTRPAGTAYGHDRPVHPFVIVRLPRSGSDTGLIPASPAGQLLYRWLAAFNQGNPAALAEALPTAAPGPTTAAELTLRRATGGYALLSAREPQPGVLVFRLRDQTRNPAEALGTLQLRPGSGPAAIASFSLRTIPPPPARKSTP